MEKDLIRRQLKKIRADIKMRSEKDDCIFKTVTELANSFDSIFIYVSMGTEADTRRIINFLSKSKKLFVPYTAPNKTMHAVLPEIPVNYDYIDCFGNVKSIPNKFYDGQATLNIVPLLGYDSNCYRLGYGAGCYDKYFAEYPRGLKVGIAYSEQMCEFTHCNTDIPLDIIITPKGA